jgi:hypothetical protein
MRPIGLGEVSEKSSRRSDALNRVGPFTDQVQSVILLEGDINSDNYLTCWSLVEGLYSRVVL